MGTRKWVKSGHFNNDRSDNYAIRLSFLSTPNNISKQQSNSFWEHCVLEEFNGVQLFDDKYVDCSIELYDKTLTDCLTTNTKKETMISYLSKSKTNLSN